MIWIVYEANGGENGEGDRVYGPYHIKKTATRVAGYINTFTTVLGRAWVLPLRDPKDGPDPLGDPDA